MPERDPGAVEADGAGSGEPGHPLGQVAVLGLGSLGQALVAALLSTETLPARSLRATVRRPTRAGELTATLGVPVGTDNRAAVRGADLVAVCVKPQDAVDVFSEIGPALAPAATLISFVAGLPLARIAELVGRRGRVRVMTNTPIAVAQGMCVVTADPRADARHLLAAEALLTPLGTVLRLGEGHLDAVTALAGSGPAYLLLMVEALIDAGVAAGLSHDVSRQLTIQTLVGTGALLREGGEPRALRAQVTSPGGTSAAGLLELERRGVRAALADAVLAAWRRAGELST